MKKSRIILCGILALLLTSINCLATNYYLSSSTGNDGMNSGKSASSPWKSLDKLKTVLPFIQAGDSVLFKCNDTFDGQLILSRSGNAPKSIYFGSYGSGKKPVISGTAAVSNWVQTANNIWEAAFPGGGSKATNFFINGIPQQIGRWPNATDPNKGYLSYESHSGTNQITDNQLTSAINWTGAEAVVRRVRWILDRLTIRSHTGNTLLFTTNVGYEFIDGFGYFIQNDPKTLDQQGEWYYNGASKKFSLYSTSDPNQWITTAPKTDVLLKTDGLSYITVENLRFVGSGNQTVDISNSANLTFRNIEVDYSGVNAVNFFNSKNIVFESNLINHTNNNAFTQNGCKNFVIRNNTIKNTALIAGMGLGSDGQYNAVQLGGTNLLVENNRVDSVGYIGINFNGDTLTIRNNLISNYCMTKDDGGGLYTWGNGSFSHSRKLIGNIVMNAIGAPEGSAWPGVAAEGIYIDDRSANVEITGNTAFNCGNTGIFLHNANHITVRNNVSYNNGKQFWMMHDNIAPTYPITNCVVDSNVFVARDASQKVASMETIDNGIAKLGSFDYNYYCRPLDDKLPISISYVDGSIISESLSLQDWQARFSKDQHSGKSPIDVAPYRILTVKPLNLLYNPGFDSSMSYWTSWSNYGNGKIALAQGEGFSGNGLKASFTSPSGKTDGYLLVTSNSFNVTKGKVYRLKFMAKGSKAGVSIKLITRKNGSPYNEVANSENVALTTSYSPYEFYIDASLTEPNSRIDFEIREGQGEVWFDNLELVELDVEKTNPDDLIRFEYNAGNSDKLINVPQGFVDVKGNPVSGSLVLKPFKSVVLFKNLNTIIGELSIPAKQQIRMFPNPATNETTIKSTGQIHSVCIRNLNGQLINSYKKIDSEEFTIHDLPKAGLYLVQVETSGKTECKKLVIANYE